MADPPVGAGAVEEFEASEAKHLLPALRGEGMEEIEVDMVGAEFFQLPVEETIPVALLLDEPDGDLWRGKALPCAEAARSDHDLLVLSRW